MSTSPWNQADAIILCKIIEGISPLFGAHVALTGGMLYKEGNRKDCDILFYRIRQVDKIDKKGLFNALNTVGFREIKGHGWCHKCEYHGKPVDAFFPEEDGGEYISDQTDNPPNTLIRRTPSNEGLDGKAGEADGGGT